MRTASARAALLCASLVAVGAPLAAQQPGHPRQPRDTAAVGGSTRDVTQMMGSMAGCPMMVAMMRGPGAALRARDTLHLSSAQVQRLEAAQRQLDQALARMRDSMRVLHPRMAALVDAPRFDESATRAAFERMGRLHTDMGVAMLRAQHETAAILTPRQRDLLTALGRARTARMKGPGADACSGMMEMERPGVGPPAARPDSAHHPAPRADSVSGRP
ncbi:MAG TPA: Spy/CpxP family protein refolding chaperone [Gemmatimonadaceae bacterium]|nr:Spy/CpxP family protein refolding chaperone [Gemmatimonadaceae bacterium]